MKRVATVCIFAALLSTGYGADRLALVRSSTQFEIERAGEKFDARADVLSPVHNGDILAAGERPLQMDLPSGSSVAVGRRSEVKMTADHVVMLQSGHVAISPTAVEPISVRYDDLLLTPVGDLPAAGSPPAMLGIALLDENRVKAASSNGRFMVTQLGETPEANRAIGFVSSGDPVVFYRQGREWIVNSTSIGQPPPQRAVRAENVNTDETVTDDDDDDEGAWLWWTAAGVGAAGLAAALIYEQEDDEDDRENREEKRRRERGGEDEGGGGQGPGDGEGGRPPFSIIAPPFPGRSL